MVRHAMLATIFAFGLATSVLAAPQGDPRDNVLSSDTADFAIFCYQQSGQLLSEGAFAFAIDNEHLPDAEEERINLTTEIVGLEILSSPNLRDGVQTGSAFVVFQPASNSWTVYGPDYAGSEVTAQSNDPKCGQLTVNFPVNPQLRQLLPADLRARFKSQVSAHTTPTQNQFGSEEGREFLRNFFNGPPDL